MDAQIHPVPTDEEAAAIVAAVAAAWGTPHTAEPSTPRRVPTWRFSARWWAQPLPHRRGRPYR